MFWFPLIVCVFLAAKPATLQFLEPNCGRMDERAFLNSHQANILRGPWMAFLHAAGKFHCGGSLINRRFVLTAHHCIVDNETLTVRLGEYDTDTDNDCSGSVCIPPYEEFEIDKAIRNVDYSKSHRFHDIALLRLKRRVHYKAHIKPICLITNTALHSQIENMQDFVTTGWGSSTPGWPSRTLKVVDVQRLDRSVCRERYFLDCSSQQICVDHKAGVSCRGDSGGPMGRMVRIDGHRVFAQIGIVSYGNPECRSPSVFTDVMGHMDWIKEMVQRYP